MAVTVRVTSNLQFTPVVMAFEDVCYYVPAVKGGSGRLASDGVDEHAHVLACAQAWVAGHVGSCHFWWCVTRSPSILSSARAFYLLLAPGLRHAELHHSITRCCMTCEKQQLTHKQLTRVHVPNCPQASCSCSTA